MKTHITRIALFSLAVAGLVAIPTTSRADDASMSDKPAAAAPLHPKKTRTAFHGSITAIDTAAMSLTVGTNVIYVTSETTIVKGGKPAILSELTVGETANGSYKADDAGKLNAVAIHAGEKEPKRPKKKAADAVPVAPAPPK